MLKRRKPIVGTIETKEEEFDNLLPHQSHLVSLIHIYTDGVIQLFCVECARSLIEFIREEEEDD